MDRNTKEGGREREQDSLQDEKKKISTMPFFFAVFSTDTFSFMRHLNALNLSF